MPSDLPSLFHKQALKTAKENSRLHNLLQPRISRLPAEVLLQVFLFYQAACFHRRSSSIDNIKLKRRECVWITHVCHSWRQIALGYSKLWQSVRVQTTSKDVFWSQPHFRRFENMLLDLKLDITGNKDLSWQLIAYQGVPEYSSAKCWRSITTLQGALERCATLSVYDTSIEIFSRIFRTVSMPNLHTLKILCESEHSNRYAILRDKALIAPSLRRLSLIQFRVDWSSSSMQGLTHLRIYSLTERSRPVLRDLLFHLQKISQLEWLDIDYAFVISDTPFDRPDPLIRFPSLRYLRVIHETNYTAKFLANVDLSSISEIHVDGMYWEFDSVDREDYDVLSEQYKMLRLCRSSKGQFHSTGAFRAHVLVEKELDEIMAQPKPAELNWIFDGPDLTPEPEAAYASWPDSYRRLIYENFFDPISSIVSMTQLTQLCLVGSFELCAREWAQLFGWLPSLSEIFISTTSTPEFFGALAFGIGCRRKPCVQTSSSSRRPFREPIHPPALPPDCIPFQSLKRVHAHSVPSGLWNNVYGLLLKSLRLRKEKGFPLSYIRFIGKQRDAILDTDKFLEVLDVPPGERGIEVVPKFHIENLPPKNEDEFGETWDCNAE